ncbi:MAG: hypothetical protein JSW04_05715 [Desulfobacterales bacterium]|nr:MAG: hypothetical protein JSV38_07750 [Desulfobacterales bacterium]UCD90922.1 MAG: hypothetical protein JSW04_05715 [Desulfobacterales bacterium]
MEEKLYEVNEYKCTVHMFDGRTIIGKININIMGRLSDMFTKNPAPFVVVYDATLGDDPSPRTLILNKSGISWIEPDEPEKTSK